MRWFPYAIAVLDIGAAFVYARNHQFALALTWLFYAAATIALAHVTR